MPVASEHHSEIKTFILVGLLLLLILAKGFFSFWVVADRGQPTWDYRPLADVPGESPYAIYDAMPHPQHVRGRGGGVAMKRNLVIFAGVLAVYFVVYAVVTAYDTWFALGRMWETAAVRPHEQPLLVMDGGLVPFSGGDALFRAEASPPPHSPFAPEDPQVLRQGEALYATFCQQCHGRHHDGQGTVGQSFAPLPGDLRQAAVQAQADSLMFREISFGRSRPGSRQPPLATTIPAADRWRIVHYVKSLGSRP
jgi:mono/diheme cytochrome c family protein